VARRRPSPSDRIGADNWPYGTAADRPSAYARSIAINVAAELTRRGWSHRELARRAGISHVTVSNVIAGTTWVDLATLAQLEIALGVELLPGGRLTDD